MTSAEITPIYFRANLPYCKLKVLSAKFCGVAKKFLQRFQQHNWETDGKLKSVTMGKSVTAGSEWNCIFGCSGWLCEIKSYLPSVVIIIYSSGNNIRPQSPTDKAQLVKVS